MPATSPTGIGCAQLPVSLLYIMILIASGRRPRRCQKALFARDGAASETSQSRLQVCQASNRLVRRQDAR